MKNEPIDDKDETIRFSAKEEIKELDQFNDNFTDNEDDEYSSSQFTTT